MRNIMFRNAVAIFVERSVGQLFRRNCLPLDADYVKADVVQYCNGMLCLTIPKKEQVGQGVINYKLSKSE